MFDHVSSHVSGHSLPWLVIFINIWSFTKALNSGCMQIVTSRPPLKHLWVRLVLPLDNEQLYKLEIPLDYWKCQMKGKLDGGWEMLGQYRVAANWMFWSKVNLASGDAGPFVCENQSHCCPIWEATCWPWLTPLQQSAICFKSLTSWSCWSLATNRVDRACHELLCW